MSQAQPLPKRARPAAFEFGFEILKAAEFGLDGVAEFASGSAAGVRAEDLPEKRVVRVAATVVAHGATGGFRHRRERSAINSSIGFLASSGELSRALFRLVT